AYSQGRPSPLGELPVQYADYAVWQRNYLEGGVLERQLEYWRERLGDRPPALELPGDRPRPAAQSHQGGSESFTIGEEGRRGLERLCRRRGTTLFMTLLAAFKTLLHRYSGQAEIVVGSPIAGRTRAETEQLIGCFVNTLVMRTDLSGNPSFEELLERVKETALGAYAHQETPFERLVEELQPERSLSRSPLFQALFTLQNAPREALELPGLELSGLAGEAQAAKFDLELAMTEGGQELAGTLIYSRDLFEAGTIRRMIGHFRTLLEGVAADAGRPVGELNLLTEGERLLLEEWNETSRAYPEVPVHELFEEQAERSPEAVALFYEERSLSYGELNSRANGLAWRLRELGVGPEARVAICLERGLEMVVALLATLKAGGAYVPLDPAYPSERLTYMLEDSKPLVLLTHGGARSALTGHTLGACVVDLDTDAPQWACHSEVNPDPAGAGLNAQSLAYILYTSGSTGLPKGVAIEHRSVVNLICWAKSAFDADALEQTLLSTSINFDLAVYECFVPLAVGATTTIVRNALDLRQTPAEVTLINTVPSAMKSLVDTNGIPKSVRTVNLAGEPLKRELAESIFAETEAEKVCNLYGPSETTTYSTWVAMERGKDFEPHIGQPISNTQIYILDEWIKLTPVGVRGEIHIGGDGKARGYLNQAEMTAERFLPDPFSQERGARIYKTGDLGRWTPAGNIEFLGRNDYQVKIRGYRIELGEIEARLASHPDIREAVV